MNRNKVVDMFIVVMIMLSVLFAGQTVAKAETNSTYSATLYWLYGDQSPTSFAIQMGSTYYVVDVAATTKIVNDKGNPVNLGSFWAGDQLTIIGTSNSSDPTRISATLVRNQTLTGRESQNQPIAATVQSLSSDTAPTSLFVIVGGNIMRVVISTATTLLTSNNRSTSLGAFWVGDQLYISGTIDPIDNTTLYATRIQNVRVQ